MTIAGWIILAVSVGGVLGLFLWCAWKVLTIPEESEHIHGFEAPPPDISGNSPNQED